MKNVLYLLVFLSAEEFNYCVFVDAVTNEQNTANNSFCINVSISDSDDSEDLSISNESVSPTTINAGETIVALADQNYSRTQSQDDLPSIGLNYYLSLDCTLSSDDILLGNDSSAIGSEAPSETESETLNNPCYYKCRYVFYYFFSRS